MTLAQKRKRNVILMIVVLVLAIGALVGLRLYDHQKEDRAKGTRITKVDPRNITDLTFYRKDMDQTVELHLDETGTWKNVQYPDANLIQGYVKYMCNSLTEVRLQKKLSETDLAQFGLAEPSMVIQAKAGNENIRLTIGDENAAGAGWYVMYEGSDDIWLMGSDYYKGLDYTGGTITYPETIQPLTVASIQHLEREQDGQKLVLDYDGETKSFLDLRITEPFHGQVFANKMQMTSFVDVYNMLSFDSCYDYECKDFSKYGFDDPTMSLKVSFMDTDRNLVEYEMIFGAKNEDGDYYVRTNYSNNVNIINGTNAFTFLSFDIFSYVYRTLYVGLGEDVEKITIAAGGKEKVLNPDPNDPEYSDIGSLVRLLAVDSVAGDSAKASDEVAKITMEWNGTTDVWTFYEYDKNSLYLVDINGKDQSFVVTKSSVDEVLSKAGLK